MIIPQVFLFLSFMNAYSGYNQTWMNPNDAPKMVFMTNCKKNYYEIMLFGLKNARATYQRLMDIVFFEHIAWNLEVYFDDMEIKTLDERKHDNDLSKTLASIRR